MLKAGKPDRFNNREKPAEGPLYEAVPFSDLTKLETWPVRLVPCLLIQAENSHARRIGTAHANYQLWPIPAAEG